MENVSKHLITSFTNNAIIIGCVDFESRRGVVRIATATCWAVWGSRAGMDKNFSENFQTRPGAHPASYSMGTGVLSQN
jgi:hypothetical protein